MKASRKKMILVKQHAMKMLWLAALLIAFGLLLFLDFVAFRSRDDLRDGLVIPWSLWIVALVVTGMHVFLRAFSLYLHKK